MTAGLIVDAWMQHPSQTMLADPMFDSLRAWSRGSLLEVDLPIEWTLAAMHEAGVELGPLCARWGLGGPIIGNDEVAEIVDRYPDRFIGVAAVNLHRTMEAVRELRRCVGVLDFRALRVVSGSVAAASAYFVPVTVDKGAITESSEVDRPSLPADIRSLRPCVA
jgi:hypothetical protein